MPFGLTRPFTSSAIYLIGLNKFELLILIYVGIPIRLSIQPLMLVGSMCKAFVLNIIYKNLKI